MTALSAEPRTVSRIVLPNEPTWDESLIAAIPAGVDDKCRFAPLAEMEFVFEPRGSARALGDCEFRITLPETNLENHATRAPPDLQKLIQILKDLRQERANELGTYASCPQNGAYFIEGLGLLAAGGKMPARDAFDHVWRMGYSARALIRKKGEAWDEVKLDLASPEGLLKTFGVTGVYPERVRAFDELLESAFKEVDRKRPRPALRVVPKEAPPLPVEPKQKAPPISAGMLIVRSSSDSAEPTGDDATYLADKAAPLTPTSETNAQIFRAMGERHSPKPKGAVEKEDEEDEDEEETEEEEEEKAEETDDSPPDQPQVSGQVINLHAERITIHIHGNLYAPGVVPGPVEIKPAPTLPAPVAPAPTPPPAKSEPPPAAKPAVEERKSRPAPTPPPKVPAKELPEKKAVPARHGRTQASTVPAPPMRGVVKVGGREMFRCRTCKGAGCESDIPKNDAAWEEHCRIHDACSVCGFIFIKKTENRRDQHSDVDHYVCECTSVVYATNKADHEKDCPAKAATT